MFTVQYRSGKVTVHTYGATAPGQKRVSQAKLVFVYKQNESKYNEMRSCEIHKPEGRTVIYFRFV